MLSCYINSINSLGGQTIEGSEEKLTALGVNGTNIKLTLGIPQLVEYFVQEAFVPINWNLIDYWNNIFIFKAGGVQYTVTVPMVAWSVLELALELRAVVGAASGDDIDVEWETTKNTFTFRNNDDTFELMGSLCPIICKTLGFTAVDHAAIMGVILSGDLESDYYLGISTLFLTFPNLTTQVGLTNNMYMENLALVLPISDEIKTKKLVHYSQQHPIVIRLNQSQNLISLPIIIWAEIEKNFYEIPMRGKYFMINFIYATKDSKKEIQTINY